MHKTGIITFHEWYWPYKRENGKDLYMALNTNVDKIAHKSSYVW